MKKRGESETERLLRLLLVVRITGVVIIAGKDGNMLLIDENH
jgi:hypothetical protein